MPLDASIQLGIRHLRKIDPIMRKVIRKAGPFKLNRRNDRFHALALAIVSQQISGKAARSVWTKLKTIASPLSPERILELPIEELRKAGLSRQKASYLLDLANHVCDGRLQLNRIGRRSDEEVIETLVAVKGIGLWTAQMFLIFSLGRLDVLPHADLGLRTAMQRLYDLDELPDRETCYRIAEPWRPYASIATWYCWRSLE
ncbi:MAG TPA: DNA-3-methyladenine glycosylase [Terriglobia bacterium]|nr:DNA-3-methyladenine glycosylase [Terriglobia bacterium]